MIDKETAPKEEDWGDPALWNFEVEHAFSKLFGKSRPEIYTFFEDGLTFADTVSELPPAPLRYYLGLFIEHLIEDREALDDSTRDYMVNAVFYACQRALEVNPVSAIPALEELMPQIKFIAENQELFDYNKKNDGTFAIKFCQIVKLCETKRST